MDPIKTMDEINQDRRRFFGTSAIAVAALRFGINPATAQRIGTKISAIKPGTNTSFGPLKQIDAGA